MTNLRNITENCKFKAMQIFLKHSSTYYAVNKVRDVPKMVCICGICCFKLNRRTSDLFPPAHRVMLAVCLFICYCAEVFVILIILFRKLLCLSSSEDLFMRERGGE